MDGEMDGMTLKAQVKNFVALLELPKLVWH
jgi:hypothetical protein